MEVYVFGILVFLVVVVLMSLGVILSNKPIKGSCGGLAALFGKGACDICGDRSNCEKKKQS